MNTVSLSRTILSHIQSLNTAINYLKKAEEEDCAFPNIHPITQQVSPTSGRRSLLNMYRMFTVTKPNT